MSDKNFENQLETSTFAVLFGRQSRQNTLHIALNPHKQRWKRIGTRACRQRQTLRNAQECRSSIAQSDVLMVKTSKSPKEVSKQKF